MVIGMSGNIDRNFSFDTYRNQFSLGNKLARMAWLLYSAFFFRPFPTKYLNGLRIAGLRLFGAKLGKRGVSIHRTVRIWAPWNLIMADYTLIDRDCRVYNPGHVILNTETVISENVFLCTASHDVHSMGHELIVKPIVFHGKNWVASDVIILPGVDVGVGAVVGAGAVVTRTVGPWKIVAGNPAVIVGKR